MTLAEQNLRNVRLENRTQALKNKSTIREYVRTIGNHFITAEFNHKTLELNGESAWFGIYVNGFETYIDNGNELKHAYVVGIEYQDKVNNDLIVYFVFDGENHLRKCSINELSNIDMFRLTNMVLGSGYTFNDLH